MRLQIPNLILMKTIVYLFPSTRPSMFLIFALPCRRRRFCKPDGRIADRASSTAIHSPVGIYHIPRTPFLCTAVKWCVVLWPPGRHHVRTQKEKHSNSCVAHSPEAKNGDPHVLVPRNSFTDLSQC